MAEDTPTEKTSLITEEEKPSEETSLVTEETKEGTSETESKDSSADEDKKEDAPETYEDFTLPEGVEKDEALMEAFIPVAKDLNLTQEQAQKLVDLQAAEMVKGEESRHKAWDDMRTEWQTNSQQDKEFGGLEFKENLSVMKKALDVFGTDELRLALETTGTGDHPEFLRFMYRVGKAVSEDKFNVGNASDTPVPVANLLFPDQN